MSRNNLTALILKGRPKQTLSIIQAFAQSDDLVKLVWQKFETLFLEAPTRFEILTANPSTIEACNAGGITYGMKGVGHGLF